MLQAVAPHRLHFELRGLFQDSHDIVVGKEVVIPLLGLERAVAFFRLLSAEGSLSNLFPQLRIDVARNALGTALHLARLPVSDSVLIDCLARIARTVGSSVCVGVDNHFVAYRDQDGPFGYDLAEPSTSKADVVLHFRYHGMECTVERTLKPLEILLQHHLLAQPHGAVLQLGRNPSFLERLYVCCAAGILPRLVRRLFSLGLRGELVLPDSLPPVNDSDGPHLTDPLICLHAPPQAEAINLLKLPSVRLFYEEAPHLLIELGFVHPMAMSAMADLFSDEHLHLFLGGRRGCSRVLRPIRVPFERFISLAPFQPGLSPAPADVPPVAKPPKVPFRYRLVLRDRAATPPDMKGVHIPWSKFMILQKLFNLISGDALSEILCIDLPSGLFCFGNSEVLYLCMGTPFSLLAPRIYAPSHLRLFPDVTVKLLQKLIVQTTDRILIFEKTEGPPTQIPIDKAIKLIDRLVLPLKFNPDLSGPPYSRHETILNFTPLTRSYSIWPLFGLPKEKDLK